jgi:hypothetical protein
MRILDGLPAIVVGYIGIIEGRPAIIAGHLRDYLRTLGVR